MSKPVEFELIPNSAAVGEEEEENGHVVAQRQQQVLWCGCCCPLRTAVIIMNVWRIVQCMCSFILFFYHLESSGKSSSTYTNQNHSSTGAESFAMVLSFVGLVFAMFAIVGAIQREQWMVLANAYYIGISNASVVLLSFAVVPEALLSRMMPILIVKAAFTLVIAGIQLSPHVSYAAQLNLESRQQNANQSSLGIPRNRIV